MVPTPLNSSASNSKPARERFSRPAAVAGIITGFLLLLLFLYPEQSLRRLLSKEGDRTAAGRNYLEAALRNNPADHQLRFALVQAWLTTGCYRNALAVLDGLGGAVPQEVRQQADRLRYAILREQLLDSDDNSAVRAAFQVQARRLLQTERFRQELATIEYDATNFALPELAGAARQRLRQLYPTAAAAAGEHQGADSYRQEATAAFVAMESATTVTERRARFIQGVQSLQSGNLVMEALQEGERHLGPLAGDQDALMVMTRVALAAGKPDKAQFFIRRALGMGKP